MAKDKKNVTNAMRLLNASKINMKRLNMKLMKSASISVRLSPK